jgi:hypothetical protein
MLISTYSHTFPSVRGISGSTLAAGDSGSEQEQRHVRVVAPKSIARRILVALDIAGFPVKITFA